jgi:hypothetical protein
MGVPLGGVSLRWHSKMADRSRFITVTTAVMGIFLIEVWAQPLLPAGVAYECALEAMRRGGDL